MLAILKWFLATLKCQYTSRTQQTGGFEKKPLNPFLGELFVGKWDSGHDDKNDATTGQADTILLTEQVSHHPPINAFTVFNRVNDIQLQGYTHIKSSFSKTLKLNVKQHGHAVLTTNGDSFLITFPSIHLEGIIRASPYVELEEKSYIQSSFGMIWCIEYSGKGYFSGQRNSFKASLFLDSSTMRSKGRPLYVVDGQWSGVSTVRDGGNGSRSVLFSDINKYRPHTLSVKPIGKQHDLESRRAWDDVAKAIELGDMKLISQTKNRLENAQRELRKMEQEQGTKWKTRWFTEVDLKQKNKVKMEGDLEGDVTGKFVALSRMAGLSVSNVPSGSLLKSHEEDNINKLSTAFHWEFQTDRWENETEIEV